MTFDLAAARHCAQIVARLYRGRDVPERIRRHLESLMDGSEAGTEPEAGQPESRHDLIGAATAAKLLDCSTRYVTRIANDLDGVQVDGGVWVFNRATVTEYVLAKNEGRQHDCV
ncbi:hypothetical protein [Mycolicibacterium sphagni]|uniref:Helix-turn-helix domain-containing protein n=1 Tax=Mycolicibacterium sphagni TaxID=1786 RepID=A0ABX2JLV8_9MYCO|nr:hypothetical protein [Mycolicibacterium sphagni]NTY58674.1 hypothetical protein [Mycolicibacterium sphagni]